jgi:integrase
MVTDASRGRALPDRTIGLRRYLTDWLTTLPVEAESPGDTAGRTITKATLNQYTSAVNLWLVPKGSPLHGLRLGDVRPTHVQQWVSWMTRAGYSANTTRIGRTVLRKALSEAVALDVIPSNPAAATIRTPEIPRLARDVLNASDAQALFAACATDEEFGPILALLLGTGARRGEVLGLAWSDVHLDARTPHLVIRRSLSVVDGKGVLGETKTDASVREVSLFPLVVRLVREHRSRQAEARLAAGDAWSDPIDPLDGRPLALVFTRPNWPGRPYDPNVVTRAIRRLSLEAIGREVTPHVMRHTAGSLLANSGMEVDRVSKLLGHSSPAITTTLYWHADAAGVAPLTDALGDILGGGGS